MHGHLSLEALTVLPESIDPFPAFSPQGLHASLMQCSRSQPRLKLYLGKTEDGIRPAMAVFRQGITLVI